MTRVRIKKSQLDRFRKLARESKNEIHACLVGEMVSPKIVKVDSIVYPQRYDIQTPDHVKWNDGEYNALLKLSKELNKQIVGDIHSHPGALPVMSETDYKGSVHEGCPVYGIVSVIGRKTHVLFWQVDSCLPCPIEYL